MNRKNIVRHGEKIFTGIECNYRLVEDNPALYEVESELDHNYNELRRDLRSLVEHLQRVEARLEENVNNDIAMVSELFSCVNSLGEVQSKGVEIDRRIAIVHTLIKTHSLLLRAAGEKSSTCDRNLVVDKDTKA